MKLFPFTVLIVLAHVAMSCTENKPPSNETTQATEPAAAAAPGGGEAQVDEYPVPVNRPSPVYPKAAMEAHQEGTVWLNVIVTDSGRVKEVSVLKSTGTPELANAAVDAAKQWTFKPAKKDGKSVQLMVTIPFRFKLAEEDKK